MPNLTSAGLLLVACVAPPAVARDRPVLAAGRDTTALVPAS